MIGGATTKLGVVLVVAGALLMAGPVFGFSTLAADRGVNIGTAEDPNALIGIVDNSFNKSADIHPKNDGEGDVFYVNNNSASESFDEFEADVLTLGGNPTELRASIEQSDDTPHDYAVTVRCGASGFSGDGSVKVSVSAIGSVSVDLERTTSEQISINCKEGGGFGNVAASDLSSSNGPTVSQDISFVPNGSIKNGNTVRIDLSGPSSDGIDYSEASITVTSPNNAGDAVFVDSETIEFTTQGKVSDEVELTVDGIQFEDHFSGGTYDVTFERTDTGAIQTTQFSAD